MPGLFGKIGSNCNAESDKLMEKMIDILNPDKRLRIDKFIDIKLPGFFGRTSLGVLNNLDQPVVDPSGQYCIIFHGELYNNSSALSDPEYILKLYREMDAEAIKELNGIFHFVLFDKKLNVLKLVSDKFGLLPLYYSFSKENLTFAGEIKAILCDLSLSREIDYQSLADFFHYGQILGNKTLFKNIKLVPPASIITLSIENRKLTEKRYWYLENLFIGKGEQYNPDITNEVVSCLFNSIRLRLKNKDTLGISLSGGLDSRGILAGLGENSIHMNSYTLGLSGCADQKLTQKMAYACDPGSECR